MSSRQDAERQQRVARFFESVPDSERNELHALNDDRLRTFWILKCASGRNDFDYLTPAEISDVLQEQFHIWLPRQRAEAILRNEKGKIARRRIRKKVHYKLMKDGVDELAGSASNATFIDPANAFSGMRRVDEILSAMKGDILVCDPYVDGGTLDYLGCCSSASSIQLLTANINHERKFRRELTAFNKEHGDVLEVRRLADRHLHDRFVIHDDGMLLFGTSLNGIGKKQSFVVALGDDLRSAVSASFKRDWSSARTLH